jgi:hypothetical protein
MAEIASAFVRVRADTRSFKAETEHGVRGAFAGVGKIVGGAFAAAGAFEAVKSITGAASKQQEELAVVRKAVEDTGAAWKVHGQTVNQVLIDLAEKSGFTVADLAQGFTRIQIGTKDTAKTLTVLDSAMDISRARHIGLGQAAVVLSRLVQGNAGGLSRLGIILPKVSEHMDALRARQAAAVAEAERLRREWERQTATGTKFTDQQKYQHKLELERLKDQGKITAEEKARAQALDKEATKTRGLAEVQARLGGQSETYAKTAEGAFSRFRETLNEFEVTLGKQVLPSLAGAALGAADFFKGLGENKQVIGFVTSSVKDFKSGLESAKGVLEAIGPPILAFGEGVLKIAQAIGTTPLLVFFATFKAGGAAVSLAEGAHRRWAAAVAASGGVQTAEAAASARQAGAMEAFTLALQGNTLALERNAGAARLSALGVSTFGGAARTAERDVATASPAFIGLGRSASTAATDIEGSGSRIKAVGRGLAGFLPSAKTLGVAAVAGLAVGIYLLSQRESDWERATHQAQAALDLLAGSLNRAKESANELARSKIDIALAKAGKESADLSLKEALAQEKATRGTKDHTGAVVQLDNARAQDRLSIQGLSEAQDRYHAASVKHAKDERDIIKSRVLEIQKETRIAQLAQKAVAPQVRAALGSVPAGPAREREQQRLTLEFTSKAVQGFVAELAKEQAANERTKPGITHNIILLKQYAEQLGRIPKPREIKLALNNKDATLSLQNFIRRVHGLAPQLDSAGREQVRRYAHALGGLPAQTKPSIDAIAHLFGTATPAVEAAARAQGRRIGAAVPGGAAVGIRQGTPGMVAAGRASVLLTAAGMERAGGIGSPSTVTAARVGLPLAQGVAAGIRTGAGLAVTAAVGLVLRVAASARQQALSGGERAGAAFARGFANATGRQQPQTPTGTGRPTATTARAGVGQPVMRVQGTDAAVEQVTRLRRALGQLPDASILRVRVDDEASRPLTLVASRLVALPAGKRIELVLHANTVAALRTLAQGVRQAGVTGTATGRAYDQNLAAAISSGGGTVAGSAESVLRAATSAADASAFSGGEQVGLDFGSGVSAGVQAQASSIAATAVTVVQNAIQAAKAGIGAKSPSTLAAREIGVPMMQGVALGIDQYASVVANTLRGRINDAVTQARDSLIATIKQGQENVRSAILSAKQNLNQIGGTLAGEVGQIIDAQAAAAAPATGKLGKLTAEFQKLKEEAAAGGASPELERRARRLQAALEAQTATGTGADTEKRKERITRRIADLTDEFNKGAITATQFNHRIALLLQREHVSYRAAGKLLGVAFADEFQAQLAGLRLQVRAIAAGPRLPGTTGFEPQITKPVEAILQANKDNAAAVKELRQAIAETITKDSEERKQLLKETKSGNKEVAAHARRQLQLEDTQIRLAREQLAELRRIAASRREGKGPPGDVGAASRAAREAAANNI